MAFDSSLYKHDAGYYPLLDGKFWFPSKFTPQGIVTFSRKAIDAAVNAELNDSDVLIATYPKTGLYLNIFYIILKLLRRART